MHRRLLLPLAAVTAAAVLASGCGKQSAAVRVGDQEVSQRELFDELELIVTDTDFRTAVFGPEAETPLSSLQGSLGPTSYSQFLIGAVVLKRVQYLVAGDVLEENGIEITDDDRAAIKRAIDRALSPEDQPQTKGIERLPAAYQEDLVEGLTRLEVLQRELGPDEYRQQMRDALVSADVHISSHFGSWDPAQGGVVPPPGPVQAPGSQDGGSRGGSGSA